MGIGTALRHRLGTLEIHAAELYRSAFINLEDLATTLASLGDAERILEIGCGDGSLGQRLVEAFPKASYLGIDIAESAGRLYRGDPSRATFRPLSTGQLLAEDPELFDLVVIVDVLHHVPGPARTDLLRDAANLTAPTGTLVVKDWERGNNVSHMLAYAADRYVSGDRTVAFPEREELRQLIADALPGFAITCETRVPPRRNNVLYALRRD
ncbi:MAG TPA: class I SAM-dependent methyltransferase [Acidimicrobiales bacterium]